jgi:hypothetical protein
VNARLNTPLEMSPEDVSYWLAQGKTFEPALDSTEIAVRWMDHDIAADVVCVVHYVPEDLDTNSQPDAVLRSVYVNGVDITDIFNRNSFGLRIEEQAIREMEVRIREAKADQRAALAGVDL